MRNVRPLFLERQRFGIQLAVQFAHVRGRALYTDVDRKGYWDERFYIAQGHFERFLVAADALQNLRLRPVWMYAPHQVHRNIGVNEDQIDTLVQSHAASGRYQLQTGDSGSPRRAGWPST